MEDIRCEHDVSWKSELSNAELPAMARFGDEDFLNHQWRLELVCDGGLLHLGRGCALVVMQALSMDLWAPMWPYPQRHGSMTPRRAFPIAPFCLNSGVEA